MAEEATVMVMEEDTAEDIGVKVTPNVHTAHKGNYKKKTI